MAQKTNKIIQLYRNNTIVGSLGELLLKWVSASSMKLEDGEQIIGRYKGTDGKAHTVYGIAHKDGQSTDYIETFLSKVEFDKAIDNSIKTAIEGLDSEKPKVANSVITGIKIIDGKLDDVGTTTGTITVNKTLLTSDSNGNLSGDILGTNINAGYIADKKGAVTADDTVAIAISKLQSQVSDASSKAGVQRILASNADAAPVTLSVQPEDGKGEVTISAALNLGTVEASNTTKAVSGEGVVNYVGTELGKLKIETNDIGEHQYITSLTQSNGQVNYDVADLPVYAISDTSQTGSVVTSLTLSKGTVTPNFRTLKVNGQTFGETEPSTLETILNGSHIQITGYTASTEKTPVLAETDTINVALGKLEKRISDVDGKAGVTSIKGATNGFAKIDADVSTGAVTLTPTLTIGTFAKDGKGLTEDKVDAVQGLATIESTTAHVQDAIAHLDYTATIEANHYITGLSQSDGIIAAQTSKLPVFALSQKDKEHGIVTNISLVEGTITPTYSDIKINGTSIDGQSDILLNSETLQVVNIKGTTEPGNADIADGDTLNTVFKKLEKRIVDVSSKAGVTSITGSVEAGSANYLTITPINKQTGDATLAIGATIGTYTNKTDAVGEGLVNTSLLQTAIQGVNGSNVALDGYTKPNVGVEAIAPADSVNAALGKLEAKVDSIKIVKNTEGLGTESLTEYQLEVNGAKLDQKIIIPKDRTLAEVQVTPHTATGYNPDAEQHFTYKVEDGKESLSFAYIMADGSYSVASIAVGSFLNTAQYGNGLTYDDQTGKVSVKLVENGALKFDDATEGQKSLKYEIEATKDSAEANNYVSNVTQETTGKITVERTALPVTAVKGSDTINVADGTTTSEKTISVKVADESIHVDQTETKAGISVGIVDCGTY